VAASGGMKGHSSNKRTPQQALCSATTVHAL
jgi:hypothetical protein